MPCPAVSINSALGRFRAPRLTILQELRPNFFTTLSENLVIGDLKKEKIGHPSWRPANSAGVLPVRQLGTGLSHKPEHATLPDAVGSA